MLHDLFVLQWGDFWLSLFGAISTVKTVYLVYQYTAVYVVWYTWYTGIPAVYLVGIPYHMVYHTSRYIWYTSRQVGLPAGIPGIPQVFIWYTWYTRYTWYIF